MSKGRQAPKIYQITLPSSGITLQYKKVSQYVVDDIRKMRAAGAPKPPLETVETADGKVSEIPNKDNPEYAAELAAYDNETELVVIDAFINLGVVLDVDEIDVSAAITEVRAELEAAGVKPSTDNPKLFYVRYIACMADEIGDLGLAIAQRSGPTETSVEAAKSEF